MATDNKYDRQIRIWGAEGQHKLNTSVVLGLGISAAGTETLKNLVLPGIGFIRIVSDELVQPRDFSRNFFVDPDSEGKNIAEEVLNNLLEMNPDVKGDFRAKSVSAYMEEDIEEMKKATFIIVDNLPFVISFYFIEFNKIHLKSYYSINLQNRLLRQLKLILTKPYRIGTSVEGE